MQALAIASAWRVLVYDPAQYWTGQFFLLSVLIYVGPASCMRRNRPRGWATELSPVATMVYLLTRRRKPPA